MYKRQFTDGILTLAILSVMLLPAACKESGGGDEDADAEEMEIDADLHEDVAGDDGDAAEEQDADAADDTAEAEAEGDIEEEEEEIDHNQVLENLGINTDLGGPTGPDGNPLPPDYNPFGREFTVVNALKEVFLAGFSHSGANNYLIDDGQAGYGDLYTTTFDWTSSTFKNVIGADADGDGIEEVVIVYYDAGASALRLKAIDKAGDSYTEHDADIAVGISSLPADGWAQFQPSLARGDLDMDGRDELIVGFSTLYVVDDMDAGFAVTSRGFSDSTYLYVAAGDIDGDGQDEFIVTEHSGGYAYCSIYDGDLSSDLIRADELLMARHVAGGHMYEQHVNVRMGDIDGDGLDEIVFLGERRDYGDAWNVLIRDDALHGLEWLELFFYASPDYCHNRGLAVLDYDGDGTDEIFASNWLFRYDEGTNCGNGQGCEIIRQIFPDEFMCYDPPSNVTAGDVDGDLKEDLLYIWGDTFYIDGADLAGTYTNKLQWSGATVPYPRLCAANVDDDSPVVQYRGEHELLFTDPTVIAVLACPPYHTGVDQNIDAASTTFGRSSGTTVDEEHSTGFSVGFSIGYEFEDMFGISKASFKVTMEDSFDWISSQSTEIKKSIAYASGPDEDKVIFTAVPFDVYYYTIISSPEPADVGNIMSVNVPREMETLSVSRTFYNENNGDTPDIDETVLGHAIGDVTSYPTPAERDALIGTGPEAEGLVSDGTPVGIGTGSITVTISRTEGQGEGTFNEFSTTVESEVGVGGVTFGTSVGFSYGFGYTITNTQSTFYEGTVGDIPESSYTPDLLYSFGLFTYPFSHGDQSFTVINYWTE